MDVLFKMAPNEKRGGSSSMISYGVIDAGLYSGITAASFGLGSFVFTQLQSRVVNPYAVDFTMEDPNYAVLIRVP